MKVAGLKSLENAHNDSIWAMAWFPATEAHPSSLLLTGSLDETVRLWNPDELTPAAPSPSTGHCLGVVSAAAHPSGAVGASASLDSFVRVFDVDSNVTIATLEAAPSEVWNMSFLPKMHTCMCMHFAFVHVLIGKENGVILESSPLAGEVLYSRLFKTDLYAPNAVIKCHLTGRDFAF